MSIITTKKRLLKLLACLTVIWSISSQELNAQINTFPYNEDFEGESQASLSCGAAYNMQTAGWTNNASNDTDWRADANGTGSSNTGPGGFSGQGTDHNPGTSSGLYMYTETSGCTNDVAILESPLFDFTSAPAPLMDFWYHMYGATMGTLTLEVTTNGGGTWTPLWTMSGDQGNNWIQANISLAAYGGMNNVQFRFNALTGTSFTSDMAIDDITIINPLPDNAGITAMISPTTGMPAGAHSVDVELQNFGSNNLNNVTIEWEIAGVPQTPVAFSGPALASFATTNVNLTPSAPFAGGTTNLKFWTSMPNGVVDTDFNNDTLYASFCTGLSGTYTVGTAASDYLTFADALNALYGCGIGGPVTMQVQAGTYTTPLNIDQNIPGLSAVNTLTWDGSAQAATISVSTGAAVTLDGAGGNGAHHITIQDFTLENTSTSTGWGVLLTNSSNYNSILNNRIMMATTNAFNTAGIVASNSPTSVTSSGDNCNYVLIEGNVITGADRGISLQGTSAVAQYNKGNVIRNNDVSDADNYGIYTYYQDSMVIEGNYIHEFPSTFHYGIYNFYSMNSDVIGNDVRATDYGIYMNRTNSQTTPTHQGIVANNMVQSVDDRAVYMVFTRNTDFYHNTIVCLNRSAGVWSNFDNTVDVKNNIFVSHNQTGGYYAFETFSTAPFMGMDNNVFYTDPNNPDLIDFGGIYADLVDWQTNGTFGYDQNSLEGLPQFYSPTDLHVDGAFLNDKGAVVTSVLTDFDGDVRPAAGAAGVDIGADEFTPPSNDAGVTDLASPTLPIAGGFSSVEINVRNFGIADLASFSVEWEIDGNAQVSVPYTGAPIAVGGNTTMILANINFPQNTTSLRFWTTMPNGMVDERFSNDTLTINLCPGLAGTYTVGSAFSDFPTVNEAFSALMTCGVSAPVTMQFDANTYPGPWILNEIPGANMTNTVTFDGMGAATVSHTGFGINTAATIIMDGVDYLTIKNFTIENTGINTAYGVLFINQADHNTLEDNVISVPTGTGLINVVGVLASANYAASTGTATEGNNANYNLIKGNDISGGEAGIILRGGIPNNGQIPSYENWGNQIVGNNIHDCEDFGIYAEEQDTFVVSGNTVYDITASTSDAIMLYDVHNYQVTGNEVTSRDYGIAIFGGFSVGDEVRNGLVANNMVASSTNGEAFYLREAMTCYVYHNTFSGMPACYLDNFANIDLRNNILATSTHYCFYSLDQISMAAMDYNLYYISGGSGNAVRFGPTTYNSLANWQASLIGYDQNSVTGNPNFVNGLHIAGSLAVDTAATNLFIPIMTDIDGDMRPLGNKPDIGADEHQVFSSDAMVVGLVSPAGCGMVAHDVIVSIANVGSSLLVSAPVTVNVSGGVTANFNATQPLIVPGATINMNMGQINTEAGGVFDFELIISVGTDQNPQNDTLLVSLNIPPSNQIALSFTGDNMVCDGSIATLAANASYAPATIHWYDAATGGNLIHVGNTFIDGPLTTGTTYYAEVQGCTSPRAMTTVGVDTQGINVDLGADVSVCGGQSTEIIPTITISPEVSILWSEGSQSSYIEVFTPGSYIATVTNANGCTDSDTIDVTFSATPNIANAVTNVSCGGFGDGAIDLTVTAGTGPFSYMWSNGMTTEDLNAIAGGSYNVTVTDNGPAGGCLYVENYQVTEPTTMSANIDATSVACNGADGMIDISVFGGSPAYTYNWTNGATTQNITNAAGGVNTVTITDANGCTSTATANITAGTPINVAVDTVYDEILALAGGISITATGGSGTLVYTWNNGATTQDVTGLTAGTYAVTVTDLATGCQQVLGNIVVVYKIPDFVNNIPSLNAFKLYPNPTSGKVWVNMSLAQRTTVQLEIMSVTGQLLQSFEPRETLEQNYELNLSEYPSGVYLARFIIGDEVMTTKVIVE